MPPQYPDASSINLWRRYCGKSWAFGGPTSPLRPGAVAACERYGFLHYAVFERTNLAAATYDGERPSGARKNWSDEFVLGRRNVYELVRADLNKETPNQLDNLVIFERFPR